MSEPPSSSGSLSVERDALAPDWRCFVKRDDAVVAEVLYDADHGWDGADHPVGWVLRDPAGFEQPIVPDGRRLLFGAQDAATAEAIRMLCVSEPAAVDIAAAA